MKKCICIPDSFKGTLSSLEICTVMGRVLKAHFPEAEILGIPVADGGEGSVDAFLAAQKMAGGEAVKIPVRVSGPFFQETQAFYGIFNNGKTAVIEMAACAGLPLAGNAKNPALATTFGVGQLIAHALGAGCKEIILGLGGSATNDAGAGMASALGVAFYNKEGKPFIPTGGTLCEVAAISAKGLHPGVRGAQIIAMCDIDNPMHGLRGAAEIFAPQKGADAPMVARLDEGLKHIAGVIKRDLGADVAQLPGAGAAGAMGAGAVAFLNAHLQMGIEVILNAVQFDALLQGADFVFTGEGKMDKQSLGGKAVIGVARRAKKQGVPVIAVVGGAAPDIEGAYKEGVSAVFSINRLPEDFSVSRHKSEENLFLTMDNIARLIKHSR